MRGKMVLGYGLTQGPRLSVPSSEVSVFPVVQQDRMQLRSEFPMLVPMEDTVQVGDISLLGEGPLVPQQSEESPSTDEQPRNVGMCLDAPYPPDNITSLHYEPSEAGGSSLCAPTDMGSSLPLVRA
ncbi:hypothetical protein V6N13_065640 [Hibiscus sabdariffa]